MQKALILLALLLFSEQLFAQKVNFLKESESFWQNVEPPLSEVEKHQVLYSQEVTLPDAGTFHLIYFNADTLPDAINTANNKVEILINKNSRFVKIGEDEGRLIGIEQNKPFEITTAHFLKKDCCNNGHNYYQQWLVIPDSSGMSVRKLHKIYFSMDTEIPDYLNINLKFKLKDRSVLQNIPKHQGEIRKVAEYSSASRGYALCSKIDDKGNIWWFVIMEPKPQMSNADLNIRRMGWMPGDGLQVISH